MNIKIKSPIGKDLLLSEESPDNDKYYDSLLRKVIQYKISDESLEESPEV